VVNGVSTRKVTRITEELCGVSFSKSTVSQLCLALDGRVTAFNERDLGAFPFVIVDAMYFKAREGDSIQSKAAMLVSGVNEQGHREILGLRIGDSESEAFWLETFRWLKQRGLKLGSHGATEQVSKAPQVNQHAGTADSRGAPQGASDSHLPQRVIGPSIDGCPPGRNSRGVARPPLSGHDGIP